MYMSGYAEPKQILSGYSNCGSFKFQVQKDAKPIKEKCYLKGTDRKILHKKIKELLKSGHLQKSNHKKWSSRASLKKINGEFEIVVAYGKLNKLILNDDNYSLPSREKVINKIKESKYFSKIAIKDGLRKIELHPDCRHFTAFEFRNSCYEWTIIPYALKNGKKYLHSLVEKYLKKIDKDHIINYQGKILIFTEEKDLNKRLLKKVLNCLKEKNLKIDYDKTVRPIGNVDYLGYEIDRYGISIGRKSFLKIINFDEPDSVKKLRSFLALIARYKKFVDDGHYKEFRKTLTNGLRDALKSKKDDSESEEDDSESEENDLESEEDYSESEEDDLESEEDDLESEEYDLSLSKKELNAFKNLKKLFGKKKQIDFHCLID